MAVNHNAEKSLFDPLYCEEEEWAEIEQEESDEPTLNKNNFKTINQSLLPLMLFDHDFLWDDEELQSLFRKERETCFISSKIAETRVSSLSLSRKQAVEWILRIHSFHGFSALTAIVAVNFLDRFLFSYLNFQKDEPWMMQLAAVASLSLAAKVEETHVPLLLDFQVEEAKYLFEAKTIQRMELLILSALKWRMNPVTPLSFLDHIVRRFGLKGYFHWEFLRSCEKLILSVIADSRFVGYLPSVLAATTMLHVIDKVEPSNIAAIDYQNQLFCLLKISKEDADGCLELISDVNSRLYDDEDNNNNSPLKRSILHIGSSPRGVIMGAIMSSNSSSNDSWEVASSPHQPTFKKARVEHTTEFLEAPQYL